MRPPNLPEASGPPRILSHTSGFLGRRESNAGGDSGTTTGGMNSGIERTMPNALISGTARGDSGVKAEPAGPDHHVRSTARGDSSGNIARGDPSRHGINHPTPAVPNEENQNAGLATPKEGRSAHFAINTPIRSQEPVQKETERLTSGLTSMNIYKESQTMVFQNWPDVRGFEAWKNHFHQKVAAKSARPKEAIRWLRQIEGTDHHY